MPISLQLQRGPLPLYHGLYENRYSHAGDPCSIPDRDRPKSLKHLVTAPLPNGCRVSYYMQVRHTREFTPLIGQEMPGIGLNLHPFTGYGDVSIWIFTHLFQEEVKITIACFLLSLHRISCDHIVSPQPVIRSEKYTQILH